MKEQIDIEIYNFRDWIAETETTTLVTKLRSLLDLSGYTVVNFTEHHFQPHGYTCIWLLAESHLALHTFPEKGQSYVELSGCRKEMNDLFVAAFHSWKAALAEGV